MRKIVQPILAVVLGLALGLGVTAIAGENPWNVLKILVRGAFGTRNDLGMTLVYATPLIFTGLSVAVAFHAGLFNIGAEGQLVMGALAAAAVGAVWPGMSAFIAPVLAGLAAILAGALWGAIPGWLRAKRGSHEVINTIMFNFIAAGLASYVTLNLLQNPDSQNPETRHVGAGYLLPQFGFFSGAPVSAALLLALAAAVLVWVLLWRTALGFEIRAVGQSESAARSSGTDTAAVKIIAMTLAGGLAGMVGVGEVLGNSGNFRLGFSAEYGFLGIAVALLGRNQPLGIVAAALLFGALHKGAAALDMDTEHVTKELSLILQALVILSVSAEGLWGWLQRRRQPC
jgi:ABC-type uncharacterized transport system permease subunit